MRFIFITNAPELAQYVSRRGVDRLMVDLELLGKVERQGHLSTVISRHSFDDIAAVRAAAPEARLMVRLNPVHEHTAAEVERAIVLGANELMLPMFRTATEVSEFCHFVGARARVCLLVETAAAVAELGQIIRVPGVTEVHVGLNDLHLDLGQNFMFEPLADGMLDSIAATLRSAGMPFGIGGLARVGEGLLPAELLMADHVRLGSTAAILSRTFHRNSATVAQIEHDMDFAGEIARLRKAYAELLAVSPAYLSAQHELIRQRVAEIVRLKTSAP